MPANLTEVIIYDQRFCDLCADGTPAEYDAKMRIGPWANLCDYHFRASAGELGTGKGQRLRFVDRRPCYECDRDSMPQREVVKEFTTDRADPTAAYKTLLRAHGDRPHLTPCA